MDFVNHKPSQQEENHKYNSSLFSLQLEGPPSSLMLLKMVLEPIGANYQN